MKRLLLIVALLVHAGTVAIAQKHSAAPLDSLLQAFNRHQDDTEGVHILNRLATGSMASDPRAGISYSLRAAALAEKKGDKRGLSESYNGLGNAYKIAARLDSASRCYEEAMAINTEINNRQGIGQNLGNIAIMYYLQGNYPKSLEYLFKALRIFEDIGDKQGIVTQLGNIGSIYEEQKNYAAALKYDTMALKKYIEIDDREGQAIQLGNIGIIYHNLGNTQQALANDYAAIALFRKLGNKDGEARNYSNLSQIYLELRDAPKMYDCLRQSIGLYEALGEDNGLAIAYGNLAEFFLKRSQDSLKSGPIAGVPANRTQCLALARQYINKAIAMHRSLGNLAALVVEYEMLSKINSAAGDYRAALTAYTTYKQLADSVYAGENSTRIAALETQREVELKNKQIELDRLAVAKKRNERGFFIVGIGLLLAVILIVFRNYRVQRVLNGALSVEKDKVERRTEELDVTNKELNTTLTELKETQQQLIIVEKQKENEMIRSRISQDIHDDISSELTRISWVSELAKAKVKKADFGEMPGLLEKITDSSRETVTKLGEIIWTVNPKNDTLASLLAYMRTHIAKFFADTPFQCTVAFPDEGTDVHINPELKRNLYLVMKESLNNIVKYSGAEQVSVSLTLNGSNYQFCVSDNGRGMEEGVVKGGGNGLGNMRRRMESVQGVCNISSSPGSGTKVCCSGILY